jgi:hypothetical protein
MSQPYDAAHVGPLVGEDHADVEAEEAVHPAHPLGVAAGEVVVDRDDVARPCRQGVEVGRQHAGEGLALAGAHLGDVAHVQRRAAHDLDVEGPLAERAPSALAGDREGLDQDVVDVSPSASRLRKTSVSARSSASDIARKSSSTPFTASATDLSRRRVLPSPARRSFCRTTCGTSS